MFLSDIMFSLMEIQSLGFLSDIMFSLMEIQSLGFYQT